MGFRGDIRVPASVSLWAREYRPKLLGLVLPCLSGSRSYFRTVLYLLNTLPGAVISGPDKPRNPGTKEPVKPLKGQAKTPSTAGLLPYYLGATVQYKYSPYSKSSHLDKKLLYQPNTLSITIHPNPYDQSSVTVFMPKAGQPWYNLFVLDQYIITEQSRFGTVTIKITFWAGNISLVALSQACLSNIFLLLILSQRWNYWHLDP